MFTKMEGFYRNQISFTKNLFTQIDSTTCLDCVYLRPIFWGIRLIRCSTFFIFFFEILKVLSICGLYRIIFFEVKLLFPTILLYVEFYVQFFPSCLEYSECLYVSIFSCMFISSFFFYRKVMRLPYWNWTIPFVLKLFAYLKKVIRFLVWLFYFTFFKTQYTTRKYKVLKLGLQLGFLIATNTCNSWYLYSLECYWTSYTSCKRHLMSYAISYIWYNSHATICKFFAINLHVRFPHTFQRDISSICQQMMYVNTFCNSFIIILQLVWQISSLIISFIHLLWMDSIPILCNLFTIIL